MPRELRDDGRTYHDVAHALAVQDARAAVVSAAKKWAGSLNASPMELLDAVRTLDAVEQGDA
jgi:hypothetical protein